MSAEELELVEKRIAEVVQENIKYEDLEKKYDEWAKLYDHDMDVWGYKSPAVAAKEVAAILGANKSARILDVCAGTGMTGKFIYEAGYQNIDATDGNAKMLEEARSKNVYKNLFVAYLGKPIAVPDNAYDVISLFGGLCDGHIKEECFSCFRELIRITKPGGFFISGIEHSCLMDPYRQKLESAFQQLVDEGLWEFVANKISKEGSYDEQVWIYKVK